MTTVNRQITLASRPVGFPRISDFNLVYSSLPSAGAGEVLVRMAYLSLDPHIRARMSGNGSGSVSHAVPTAIGEVMPGRAVGFVMESCDPKFQIGDAVEGSLGWQEYALVEGHELRPVDLGIAPVSTALGVLGMPGLSAFFGLLSLCDPKPGETMVVSGAAGTVGMIAGQIAKIKECRVVGVAGPEARSAWLVDELGFDGAFNHRNDSDLHGRLEELCPDGIDVYFDNVGGAVTDAVVGLINDGARICVCEQMSQYNLEKPEIGPRWLGQLIVKRAKVEGFRVADYAGRFAEAWEQLAVWLSQGKLKYREDIAHSIESAPQAFIRMLNGKNQGKQLVHFSNQNPAQTHAENPEHDIANGSKRGDDCQ